MRFTTSQYLEKEVVTVSGRNNNSSVVLLDGQPVYFDNNNVTGVYLGVDVKRRSEALGTSPVSMFAGIWKCDIAAGSAVGVVSEIVAYGFTDAIVTRRTRAATTDTWASTASFGVGDQLIGETTGNNLIFFQAVPGTIGETTTATENFTLPSPVFVVAGESAVTLTTGASSDQSGNLAWTQRMKVFVRAM